MACRHCGNTSTADGFSCKKCVIAHKEYTFQVITNIPKDGEDGNLYDDIVCFNREALWEHITNMALTTSLTAYKKIRKSFLKTSRNMYQIHTKSRAFDLGEIVIVHPQTGRELIGAARKPSKWWVEYEEFETLDAALKCSYEVAVKEYGEFYA